jgi:molybdopterin synthase catalytic subunit
MSVLLKEGPLSLDAVYDAVRHESHGGVVLFVGAVRATEEGRPITSISYEAYASMARKEMEKICRKTAEQHEAVVCAHHRFGDVPVGDAAVIVAASAVHRSAAFAACRQLIDEIKHVVPIWKVDFARVTA